MLLGIQPEEENRITKISDKISGGSFLEPGDKGVILGEGLAKFLELGVGDTLVLLGQGYHGISANGLFIIQGLLKHPNQEFNKRLILMDLENARDFYSAYGLSTALVVMTDDHYKVNELKEKIEAVLPPEKTVMTWIEMQPELEQLIKSDRGSGIIMLGILYMVIAFGMFSVVMMMVKERQREFGVMHAVGMKKNKLSTIVFYETVFIGLLGCITGLVISYLFCLWFFYNPIPLTGETATAMDQYGMEPYMFFSLKASLFYSQMILVFFISVFISLFPIYNIHRLKITKALRA